MISARPILIASLGFEPANRSAAFPRSKSLQTQAMGRRDSMISAFRVRPAVSGRGLYDIDRV